MVGINNADREPRRSGSGRGGRGPPPPLPPLPPPPPPPVILLPPPILVPLVPLGYQIDPVVLVDGSLVLLPKSPTVGKRLVLVAPVVIDLE